MSSSDLVKLDSMTMFVELTCELILCANQYMGKSTTFPRGLNLLSEYPFRIEILFLKRSKANNLIKRLKKTLNKLLKFVIDEIVDWSTYGASGLHPEEADFILKERKKTKKRIEKVLKQFQGHPNFENHFTQTGNMSAILLRCMDALIDDLYPRIDD